MNDIAIIMLAQSAMMDSLYTIMLRQGVKMDDIDRQIFKKSKKILDRRLNDFLPKDEE